MSEGTNELIRRFGNALRDKMNIAEEKYGFKDDWFRDDWEEECQRQLAEHVQKGDPLDVAAYAAFCWARGWKTFAATRNAKGYLMQINIRITQTVKITQTMVVFVEADSVADALVKQYGESPPITHPSWTIKHDELISERMEEA